MSDKRESKFLSGCVQLFGRSVQVFRKPFALAVCVPVQADIITPTNATESGTVDSTRVIGNVIDGSGLPDMKDKDLQR